MKNLHKVTFILLVIGGLNWGVFGIFGTDIGSLVGGMSSMIAKIIYILVGLSAVYEVVTHKQNCKNCAGDMKKPMTGGMPSSNA